MSVQCIYRVFVHVSQILSHRTYTRTHSSWPHKIQFRSGYLYKWDVRGESAIERVLHSSSSCHALKEIQRNFTCLHERKTSSAKSFLLFIDGCLSLVLPPLAWRLSCVSSVFCCSFFYYADESKTLTPAAAADGGRAPSFFPCLPVHLPHPPLHLQLVLIYFYAALPFFFPFSSRPSSLPPQLIGLNCF